MKTVVETPRLILRQFIPADLDFIAAMHADAEVMRFWPKPYSRAESEEWLQRQFERYAKEGHGVWLVVDKAAGTPLGRAGLTLQDVDGVEEPEIGYMIHRPFWRHGLATEAAIAIRDYAFDVRNIPRVVSLIRPQNIPSQGVAKKLGMTAEPRLVQHGGFDHMVFALANRQERSV
jgi:RimJ/RimL family protein N-acetyltransferase